MKDTFYFLKFTNEKIEGQNFICCHILDFDKTLPFKIFKKYSKSLEDTVNQFSMFEDVSNFISYDVKYDKKNKCSKVVLDINI